MHKRDRLLIACEGTLKNRHKGNYHQKTDEIARCEKLPVRFLPNMENNEETGKYNRHPGKPVTIEYQNDFVVNVECGMYGIYGKDIGQTNCHQTQVIPDDGIASHCPVIPGTGIPREYPGIYSSR